MFNKISSNFFFFFFYVNIQSHLRNNFGGNFESNDRFFQVSMQPDVPTCVAFLSLFHYFQLTNYFWMFVEGNRTFRFLDNSRVSTYYVARIDFTFSLPNNICYKFHSFIYSFLSSIYVNRTFILSGLYLYLLVVKTFTGDNIKLRLCLIIGWGKVSRSYLFFSKKRKKEKK